MTPNRKSLVLAALLISSVLALIFVWAKSHEGASARVIDRIEPRRSGAPSAPLFAASSGAARREHFAATLAARFARKGQPVKVESVGPGSTVFRFTWPADRVDQSHLDQLKTAMPFHRELRGMGFRALVLRAGERVVWSHSF